MTCGEVGELLSAFVDTELDPQSLLEVARHAGHCTQCDGSVRDLLAVREAVAADVDRALGGMDLSGVWAHVDREITRAEGQAAWRERGRTTRGRLRRSVPVWGTLAAIAAGAMLFVRTPAPTRSPAGAPSAVRVATKRLPNHVYIDRLAGKDIALRREPKSGTTMIWVNHEVEESGW